MGRFYRYSFALLALFTSLLFFWPTSAQSEGSNIDSLKRALQNITSDTLKVNVLLELASGVGCDDTGSKLSFARQARNLTEKCQWEDGMFKCNIMLGDIYYGWCINNYSKALIYYLKADSIAIDLKDKSCKVIARRNIASIYQKMGQYRQAIDFYRQVIALDPDADEEMSAWGNLGVEYNSIGDYNEALRSYYRSLRVLSELLRTKTSSETKDTIQLAGLLLNIGDIYKEMAQPDKAFENYDSVYRLGLSTKTQILKIIGLMGMGEIYQAKNNFDKSIEYYQNALENCTEQGEEVYKVDILNALAKSYLGKGDLDKAMSFAKSSLSMAEQKLNNEKLTKAYTTLGKVYLQQKQFDVAISYLQKALEISKTTGAQDDEKDAWFVLSKTYDQMNQPSKAFDAYKHFITIRDSLYNIDKAKEFTRQEVGDFYKNKELADELNYGKKIARQQVLTYSGYTGLGLVLLLAFFIFRNYNIQKKYNELLSKEKQRHLAHIEAQDTVLTDIAHIQSHQVRGPVATILGLTQIFNYDDPTDPVNKEIIEGLSIVTQKLDTVVKEVILMENKLKAEQGKADKDAVS